MQSRNKREGHYVGNVCGRAVRYGKLFRSVRSAKARLVLRKRRLKRLKSNDTDSG